MSNEIKVAVAVSCINGLYSESFKRSIQIDQSAVGAAAGVAVVSTTAADVPLGDVSTAGVCVLQNLDDTNYCDYGLNDSGTLKAIGRLLPGEVACLRLVPAAALMAQAHTASVKVAFWILQN